MYNHHKTDGIFLALAFVGFEIMDEQACKAAKIADALGDRESKRRLEIKADQCLRSRSYWRTRAKAWERWNRERHCKALGLALALVGALAAEENAHRCIKILELDTAYQGPAITICQDVADEAEMAFTAARLKVHRMERGS